MEFRPDQCFSNVHVNLGHLGGGGGYEMQVPRLPPQQPGLLDGGGAQESACYALSLGDSTQGVHGSETLNQKM